jgi:ubiquinone/menaquinone biosynthesis C-methylase UbiE
MLFVACGDGWIVEEAWRRAVKGHACGLDTSPALIACATELRGVPGKIEFKTWDGTRLPYPSQSFDRLFSTFALERRAEPAGLLGEMHRVLQPGGEVYLLEVEQWTDGRGESAPAMLTAALREAGFSESHALVHRAPTNGRGGEPGVIVRARCPAPSSPDPRDRASPAGVPQKIA